MVIWWYNVREDGHCHPNLRYVTTTSEVRAMEREQIRQIIIDELPSIVEQDREIQDLILRLAREHFADKQETDNRFERMLEELHRKQEESNRRWEEHMREFRAMREEQARRWEEHMREFRAMREEQARRWEEHMREFRAMQEEQARRWEEQNRRWEEQNRRWEEQNRRWEEHDRRWEEHLKEFREMQKQQDQKWQENSARIDRILDLLAAQARKHDQSIGALGARWGIQTEESFRNALAGILGDLFGLEVKHLEEHDAEGVVFGHPAQVELDLIIKDSLLILGEIRASMSSEDMYALWRKAQFYEKKHGRRADRVVVISPMVPPKAREVAKKLGIEVYSYAEDAGAALASSDTELPGT